MARLTADQWKVARTLWEADPTLTFDALGKQLGVSDVAVLKAAKREGWERTPSLATVNEAAQFKADECEVSEATKKANQEVSDLTAKKEAATDLRAKLIQSHRAEWRKHAGLYPLEAIKEEFDIGKSAKISAEMLSIRQKGERIAWGMDESQTDQTIVIERSYGKGR